MHLKRHAPGKDRELSGLEGCLVPNTATKFDWTTWKAMDDFAQIPPGSYLVIKRVPVSSASFSKKEEPFSFQKSYPHWQHMDEEERISALVDTADRLPLKGFSSTPMHHLKRPHATYSCNWCGAPGEHFISDCPKRKDSTFTPLFKRTVPKGVPRDKFRLATTEEEKAKAFIAPSGAFLVYK